MSRTPKKPDALEAMVLNACLPDFTVDAGIAASLLRRYHARVRRAVKQYEQQIKLRKVGFERLDGYLMACTDILAAMDRLKKGIR